MMVTFGDNPNTDPHALSLALQGTRRCLQNAIKDARALKRKMARDYARAKVVANLHRAKKKDRTSALLAGESDAPRSGNVDPDMLFEAISGYSKVGHGAKCGFDGMQLEKLFPEEMNAYRRWRMMHKAYTDNSGGGDNENDNDNDNDKDGDDSKCKLPKQQQEKDGIIDGDGDVAEGEEEDGDEEDNEQSIHADDNDKEWGGHLKDRLAQFDARTERMKEEWYMDFSVVRQGSFLSRSSTSTAGGRQWEKARKEKRKGKGNRKTSWEILPASYVQFLHWIGFDHRSALPPPDEKTTEALAFLGYDFLGKIVEKSIFLRCLEKREQSRMSKHNDRTDANMILELEEGEQLSKEDIERALNDSTVGAKPLYCATNSALEKGSYVQLYFGPGFEDRIEMELEQ